MSMLIDHIAMCFIAAIMLLPVMLLDMLIQSNNENYSSMFGEYDFFSGSDLGNGKYLFLLAVAFYFCKDSVNGRSIAKRLLKLKVVNNNTELNASPIQCLIRNLFCIVWPIELIVTLFSPHRRIGDFIANTKVVQDNITNTEPKQKLINVVLALFLAYSAVLMADKLISQSWEVDSDFKGNNIHKIK